MGICTKAAWAKTTQNSQLSCSQIQPRMTGDSHLSNLVYKQNQKKLQEFTSQLKNLFSVFCHVVKDELNSAFSNDGA